MPDFALCPGGKCRLRTTCARFLAKSDEFGQVYFTEPPYTQLDECTKYMHDDTRLTFGEWLDRAYPGIRVRLSEGSATPLSRSEFDAALDTLTDDRWPR